MGYLKKNTSEVQYQWRHKVYKYTIGPSFQAKSYNVSDYSWRAWVCLMYPILP